MKTVKQILEQNSYSSDTNSIVSGLSQLAECGLFDEAKLPLIKRGLTKTNVNEMTEAEKKSLHYFIESLMAHVLNEQQDYLSKLDPKSRMNYPSEKDMPSIIVLKRKAIRVYPDNQKVALYYSQALDKYVSIPFGPSAKNLGTHLTMNEEALTEISQDLATRAYVKRRQNLDDKDLDPKEKRKQAIKLAMLTRSMRSNIKNPETGKIQRTWAGKDALKSAKFQSIDPSDSKKRQGIAMNMPAALRAKTPGATGAAVMGALSHGGAEGIGAAIGAGLGDITRKLIGRSNKPDPTAKTIIPGKVKKELENPKQSEQPKQQTNSSQQVSTPTPTPTPNVPVAQRSGAAFARNTMNKPIKESFKQKLEEKRQEQLNELSWEDVKSGAKTAVDFAGDVSGVNDLYSAGKKAFSGDYAGAASDAAWGGLKAATTVLPLGLAAKGAIAGGKLAAAGAAAAGKTGLRKAASTAAGAAKGAVKGALKVPKAVLGAADAVGKALAGSGGGDSEPLSRRTPADYQFGNIKPQVVDPAGNRTTVDRSKSAEQMRAWSGQPGYYNEQTNFNKIRIISENRDIESELVYEDSSITVNNRIAKKIMNLHESLNKRNKRKVEKMINEDITSLRKVINFAVRQ
jgi:hypothetical protein